MLGGVVIPAPPQVPGQRLQPVVRGRDELSLRARLTDDGRELRPGHGQHAHGVGAEHARLDRLHDEHALQQSLVDERYAEERVVRVFARLAEIFESRMPGRILDHLRLQLLADEAGQTFRQPHAHAPDAARPQADRRREHERRAIGLEQIHRTHVGVECALYQLDDVGERFLRVSAVRDEVTDLFKSPEERVALSCHAAEHSKIAAANVTDFMSTTMSRFGDLGDIYVIKFKWPACRVQGCEGASGEGCGRCDGAAGVGKWASACFLKRCFRKGPADLVG